MKSKQVYFSKFKKVYITAFFFKKKFSDDNDNNDVIGILVSTLCNVKYTKKLIMSSIFLCKVILYTCPLNFCFISSSH